MADVKDPIPPVDWSIREASTSDVLIALLGRLHGEIADEPNPKHSKMNTNRMRKLAEEIPGWKDVAEPDKFSYTQWEVLAAVSSGRKVLLFSPDSYSTDEDLKDILQSDLEEPVALQYRHEFFCRWIRSRSAEHHFQDRSDLLNKVREALKRLMKIRLLLSWAFLFMVVLVLAFSAIYSYRYYTGKKKEEALLRQKSFAFALGCSVAMIGQSTQNIGGTAFEKSLAGLDFPSNQIRELVAEYDLLERSVDSDEMTFQEFEKAKDDLTKRINARSFVLGGEECLPLCKFGQDVCQLRLFLNFWDTLEESFDPSMPVKAIVGSLLEEAESLRLPVELKEHLEAFDRIDFSHPVDRKRAIRALDRIVRYFGIELDS